MSMKNRLNSFFIPKALKIVLNPPALNNSKLSRTAKVSSHSDLTEVTMGDYSYVGHYSFIVRTNIGKFCSIADKCSIGGAMHHIERVSLSPVFHEGKNILKTNFAFFKNESVPVTTIENDVWIGMGCFIKAGVKIHTGSVVGMGSVVTSDIPPYEIWAGNPARKIKNRFSDDIKMQLLKIEWWNWDVEMIKSYADFFDNPDLLIEKLHSDNNGGK